MRHGTAESIILKSVNLEQKYIRTAHIIYIILYNIIVKISIDITSVGLASARPNNNDKKLDHVPSS